MFEELRNKVSTIDSVLNKEFANRMDALDIRNGFDPSKDYGYGSSISCVCRELEKFHGVEASKKTCHPFDYLLLEVKLMKEGDEYSNLYLRGFEYLRDGPGIIAGEFLREDLKPILPSQFELPTQWPVTKGRRDLYSRHVTREVEGLVLSITPRGGGNFSFEGNRIDILEACHQFGVVPSEHKERFKELLQQLVQKPAYNGFQVNFG